MYVDCYALHPSECTLTTLRQDVSTPGLDLRRDVRSVGRRSENFECEGGSIGDLLGGFIADIISDKVCDILHLFSIY